MLNNEQFPLHGGDDKNLEETFALGGGVKSKNV